MAQPTPLIPPSGPLMQSGQFQPSFLQRILGGAGRGLGAVGNSLQDPNTLANIIQGILTAQQTTRQIDDRNTARNRGSLVDIGSGFRQFVPGPGGSENPALPASLSALASVLGNRNEQSQNLAEQKRELDESKLDFRRQLTRDENKFERDKTLTRLRNEGRRQPNRRPETPRENRIFLAVDNLRRVNFQQSQLGQKVLPAPLGPLQTRFILEQIDLNPTVPENQLIPMIERNLATLGIEDNEVENRFLEQIEDDAQRERLRQQFGPTLNQRFKNIR